MMRCSHTHLGLVAVCLALLVGSFLWGCCGGLLGGPQSSPERLTRTYVDAANAGDTEQCIQLWSPDLHDYAASTFCSSAYGFDKRRSMKVKEIIVRDFGPNRKDVTLLLDDCQGGDCDYSFQVEEINGRWYLFGQGWTFPVGVQYATVTPFPSTTSTLVTTPQVYSTEPVEEIESHEVGEMGQPWRIIPISVYEPDEYDFSAPGAGWKLVTVLLALENTSDIPQALSFSWEVMKAISITTAEGYAYPALFGRLGDLGEASWIGTQLDVIGSHYAVPGGFSVHTIGRYYQGFHDPQVNRLTFKVAEATQGYQVLIPGFPPINLDRDVQPVVFPTDLPRGAFNDLGTTVTVPGKGSISVTEFHKSAGVGELDVEVTLVLTNESKGYDQDFVMGFVVIGDDGILHPVYPWPRQFLVGPSQQTEARLPFHASPDAHNLKLGISGDVNAVFNLE